MDIQLKKRPWYIRYRYYLLAAVLFIALVVYVIVLTTGPRRYRVQPDAVTLAEVRTDKFLEYVDVEGLTHPILTLKVNTLEAGTVQRIVHEEGAFITQGDTILVLTNTDLTRTIADQYDEWEKQRYTYRERELEMEQKTLVLQQQALQTSYEINSLRKSYALAQEEHRMGIRSRAQLEVAEEEFNYKLQRAQLQMQSLHNDSAVSHIRRQLLLGDMRREEKRYMRNRRRLDDLIVRAPISGQLSFINAVPGQQIGSGQSIGEIKVPDQFKMKTQLSEYYIDRITTGLPATILYQQHSYPLRISKVVPEVVNRQFAVELLFTDSLPDNIRMGKSYRIQIELGQAEDAIVIPRGNFYQQTGGRWIYRLNADGTRATKVPITIGRQNPQQYEVLEGLRPGDRVLTTGYDQFGDVEELVL